MTDLGATYHSSRARIAELAATLAADELAVTVPACPDWTVHDLLAHVAGMADALASGDVPQGDVEPWIHRVLTERRDLSVAELMARWDAAAPPLDAIMELAGPQLAPDCVTHEHDLRGALGRPADRDHADVATVVPTVVAMPAPILQHRGLGAIEVVTPAGTFSSHDAEVGLTLRCTPWEALRVFESRRTAAEITALDHDVTGDIADYVSALDRRQPLPTASLGET